jgi:hypothetical protein
MGYIKQRAKELNKKRATLINMPFKVSLDTCGSSRLEGSGALALGIHNLGSDPRRVPKFLDASFFGAMGRP